MDAPAGDGADDWDAALWDGECDEPCRDGDDGGEPSGVFTGELTGGVGTVGVETDGVVMAGVVTRGVVIGPAVTDGMETAGRDICGTDTDGRLAEAAGTLTPTATDNAPHTAREIRRQRLTDWTTAPLRSNGKPLV